MEQYKINLNALGALPLYGLPNFVQSLIGEVAERLRTPPEYVTATLFAVSSIAAGKDWEVKFGDYSNRLHNYYLLIGNSGTGKSTAFDVLAAPLIDLQCDLRKQYKAALADYRIAEKAASKAKKGEAPVSLPARPKEQSIYVDDVTPERRWAILEDSPKGLLWNGDEIPTIQKDPTGRNRKAPDVDAQIRAWNGSYLEKSTITGGTNAIEKPFLVIIGGIQPKRIATIFADEEYISSGYLQRYLLFWPEAPSLAPSIYDTAETPSINPQMLTEWQYLFKNLYYYPQPLEIAPSDEAAAIYRAWKVLTAQMQTRGDIAAEIWGKLHRHALRLAGLAHILNLVCGEASGAAISPKVMQWACDSAFYFFAQQLKAISAIQAGRLSQPSAASKPPSKAAAIAQLLKLCGTPTKPDGSPMNGKELAALFGISRPTLQEAQRIAAK